MKYRGGVWFKSLKTTQKPVFFSCSSNSQQAKKLYDKRKRLKSGNKRKSYQIGKNPGSFTPSGEEEEDQK